MGSIEELGGAARHQRRLESVLGAGVLKGVPQGDTG